MKANSILLYILVLTLSCDRRMPGDSQKQPEIKSREETSVLNKMAPESGPRMVLSIDGREFSKVRGNIPYYLVITQLNAIYFVTDGPGQQSVCHVFDLPSRKDTAKTTHITELGYGIGISGDRSESIEGVRNNIVAVSRLYNNKKCIYSLDLNVKKLTQMEILVLERGTKVLERHKFDL